MIRNPKILINPYNNKSQYNNILAIYTLGIEYLVIVSYSCWVDPYRARPKSDGVIQHFKIAIVDVVLTAADCWMTMIVDASK
jgi:hypothetical protein